jgi:hypothetical protein
VAGMTMIVQLEGYLSPLAFVVCALRLPGEPAKPNHVATLMRSRLAFLPAEPLNRSHFFFECCHCRAYRSAEPRLLRSAFLNLLNLIFEFLNPIVSTSPASDLTLLRPIAIRLKMH